MRAARGWLWAGAAWAQARFGDWLATEALAPGAATMRPDFKGHDAQAREFRTAIRDGTTDGSNYAGRWSATEIGCGTACRFA